MGCEPHPANEPDRMSASPPRHVVIGLGPVASGRRRRTGRSRLAGPCVVAVAHGRGRESTASVDLVGLDVGARELVPPRGFEPLISTLKGWRPRPLDDGGTGTRGSLPEGLARPVRAPSGRLREQEQDDRAGQAAGPDDRRDPAADARAPSARPFRPSTPGPPRRAQRVQRPARGRRSRGRRRRPPAAGSATRRGR